MSSNKIGDVRRVWDRNPEAAGAGRLACSLDFRLRADGVQVFGIAPEVWVEHRTAAPVFSGPTRDDVTAYASGTEVYDVATGDFWVSNQAVNAGESPTTTAAKWDRVVLPAVLAEYVARSVYYSLSGREEEVPENFNAQDTAGWPLLAAEIDRIERQQGQARGLNVRTGRR